tara:strand:- start:2671 stop:2838 length:168 start_codon:yes stop_codon:yes gene_type:complete
MIKDNVLSIRIESDTKHKLYQLAKNKNKTVSKILNTYIDEITKKDTKSGRTVKQA